MSEARAVALPDARATEDLGAALARASEAPCVIHLAGDLGTGKTTLVRGFLRGLGYTGRVTSPSYSLMEPYELEAGRVFHLDLYRLSDPDEAAWLGLEELEREPARVLVEWPERGGAWLPPADIAVHLAHAGSARRARVEARSARGRRLLERAPRIGDASI